MRGIMQVALVCGFLIGIPANANTIVNCAANDVTSSMSLWRLRNKLFLSGEQRRIAFDEISQQATKEKAPAGFTAKVGQVLPDTIATHPIPVSVANDVPKLRPYSYALLDRDRVLIVNPDDHKIVEAIKE